MNIPKITILLEQGYHPDHLREELENIYPQIMRKMKFQKFFYIVGLSISSTLLIGSFNKVNACNLPTSTYHHQDGTKLYLEYYGPSRNNPHGGPIDFSKNYKIYVSPNGYTVDGSCKGNRFVGYGGHDPNDPGTIVLEKRGSNTFYYYDTRRPKAGGYYSVPGIEPF